MQTPNAIRLWRGLVLILALAPAGWLLGGWLAGGLGADPVERVIHFTGQVAFAVLLATLALGPVARISRMTWLLAARRGLGVMAFAWATAHALAWAGLDQYWEWMFMVEDVAGRPYLQAGLIAWLILVPLAVTSTDGWQRRLGPRGWTWLHRLAYAGAGIALLHVYLQIRADYSAFIVLATALAVIVVARLGATRLRRH